MAKLFWQWPGSAIHLSLFRANWASPGRIPLIQRATKTDVAKQLEQTPGLGSWAMSGIFGTQAWRCSQDRWAGRGERFWSPRPATGTSDVVTGTHRTQLYRDIFKCPESYKDKLFFSLLFVVLSRIMASQGQMKFHTARVFITKITCFVRQSLPLSWAWIRAPREPSECRVKRHASTYWAYMHYTLSNTCCVREFQQQIDVL